MTEYSVEEVREVERILRKYSNGPGTFDYEASDMLLAYADLREQIERAREGVTCPECGAPCHHKESAMDSGDVINDYTYDPGVEQSDLRKSIRGMAEMLENGEWANVLSTDSDVARLDVAITRSTHLLPSGSGADAAQIIDEFIQCQSVGRVDGKLIAAARDWLAQYHVHPPAQAAQVDAPAQCANGCPEQQVCDYCQPRSNTDANPNARQWIEQWEGSGPQRGWHIRNKEPALHGERIAYLGDIPTSESISSLVAAHNSNTAEPVAQGDAHVLPNHDQDWAVARWMAEVSLRPLRNIHRRALDDTWRQVIRHFGGDDVVLCGPRHDDLLAAAPSQEPQS